MKKTMPSEVSKKLLARLAVPQVICPNCGRDAGNGLGSELDLWMWSTTVVLECNDCGWQSNFDFLRETVVQSVPNYENEKR